jgi:hypothetical protein
MLCDLTGSEKSNMAASKPEVPISQLVDKIGTKFQRVCLCFRGPAFRREYPCRMLFDLTGSENSMMAAP